MNIKTQAAVVAAKTGIDARRVENTLLLLQEGATIPFISRYRKERTGGLDEVKIAEISNIGEKVAELDARKKKVISTIEEAGKLTAELRRRIEESWDSVEIEDIYLPYRPRRRTKAQIARENGLEPLAMMIMAGRENDPRAAARKFTGGKVKSVEEALSGASDIIAEKVCEDGRARNAMRSAFRRGALIRSRVVPAMRDEPEAARYYDYFDFSEPLRNCTSHRFLAMRRGAEEGVLRVSVGPEGDDAEERIKSYYSRGSAACRRIMEEAVEDSCRRLLGPQIETEFMSAAKERADEKGIAVFGENLRQLLLAAPLGQKRVMGVDPGYRTGCKVVCLDAQGNLLHHEAIFPHPPQNQEAEAAARVMDMAAKYGVEAIAIGNGTASRETERFIKGIRFDREPQIFVVSEDGASVYSASKVAREEFPREDVTVRGAVSIGRRLMDPLAELVKIDPKSIGVGQYQHDVDQSKLKQRLDRVVESCVNSVGVNLNTASVHLLTYISGLGPALARNIVDYRAANGAFRSRRELLKVPRLGQAAFRQCAGFLRIDGGDNPLDNSAVHPESYGVVERMARDAGCTVAGLMADAGKRRSIRLENYVGGDVGMPTLTDIMAELEKPGRDPREQLEEFSFDPNITHIEQLREGMELPGIVTNITQFGAFVDIGVHHDGLVHISQMADRFVSDPMQVVRLHQHVRVRVLGVDLRRGRISLTMRLQ